MKMLIKQVVVAGLLAAGSIHAAQEVACRVETDRDVYPAGKRGKAVVKVTLSAPKAPNFSERPPVNLTLVIDRSGSMSGEKLEKAKEAAIVALRRLGPKDVFSLVTYDSAVQTVVPAQSAANSEWIEGRIRSINSGGNTALFAGVSQGASEVRKNLEGNYIHRILLLSDGLANEGPSTPDELGRLGSALMKEGIAVTTIGVGTDYNEDLMTRLSQRSDGNTYFVESSRDLPRLFAAELGEVLTIVATSVEVEITFPEGVKPLRFIGRDGRIGKQVAYLNLNQLYGGQEKYALIEVDLSEGFVGETRRIAEANVRYENRINYKPGAGTAMAHVQFSEQMKEIDESVNKTVIEAQVVNVLAMGNSMAIQMADESDAKGAADLLITNYNWAVETAQKYDLDDAAMPVIEEQSKEAEMLQRQGNLSPAQRKAMVSRNSAIETGQRTAPVVKPSDWESFDGVVMTNVTENVK